MVILRCVPKKNIHKLHKRYAHLPSCRGARAALELNLRTNCAADMAPLQDGPVWQSEPSQNWAENHFDHGRCEKAMVHPQNSPTP